jgi:hypothetical protein
MSKYLIFTDLCADEATLLAALAELGFGSDRLERGTDLPLYDYHGARRSETADLVIRRRHLLPASNDIGFARTPAGLVPIVSEYDQRRLRVGGKPFLTALKTAVNTRAALEIARRFGGRVVQQRAGERLIIRALR